MDREGVSQAFLAVHLDDEVLLTSLFLTLISLLSPSSSFSSSLVVQVCTIAADKVAVEGFSDILTSFPASWRLVTKRAGGNDEVTLDTMTFALRM